MKNLFVVILTFIFLASCDLDVSEDSGVWTMRGAVTEENGEACVGAQVQIKKSSDNKYKQVLITDNEGKFIVENIVSDLYSIDISMTGYSSVAIETFYLNSDFEIQPILKHIPSENAVYTFSGLVQTSSGDFAEGAVVQLIRNNINYGNAVLCGEDGAFSISGIEAGNYTAHISREDCDIGRFSNLIIPLASQNFMIVKHSAEKITQQDEEGNVISTKVTSPKYTINGIISLAEGGFANGAELQLFSGGALYGGNVIANIGGNYTFYNVVDGNYTVRVQLDGYKTITIPGIIISGGNKNNVNYSLIKSYRAGDVGPSGGWIIFAGTESTRQSYGFTYIELAPTDAAGPYEDGKAIFGSYRNPQHKSSLYYSKENTDYVITSHAASQGGDFVGTGLAAEVCAEYTSNGYKDWVLPTSGVFELIKNSGQYQNYNLRLNEQYWCSNTGQWTYTHVETFLGFEISRTEETRAGYRKFRFEPPLATSSSGENESWDFLYTRNGGAQHYVRAVRYF